MSATLYMLVIELDGQIPPGRWYTRINRITNKLRSVRGDNDYSKSALERRGNSAGTTNMVVEQEGVLIFTSKTARDYLYTYFMEDIAPEIARTPDTFGRPGRMPTASCYTILPEQGIITPEMSEMTQAVESKMKLIGRPPAAMWHTITCNECLSSYSEHVSKSKITHCKHCSSIKIRYREGEVSPRYIYAGGDDYSLSGLWISSRAQTTIIEPYYSDGITFGITFPASRGSIPEGASLRKIDHTQYFLGDISDAVWGNIKHIAKELEKIPDIMVALRLLDAIFSVERFWGGFDGSGHDAIEEARAVCLAKTYVQATRRNIDCILPHYRAGMPDLFTASLLVNHDEIADIYLTYLV